jgi:hypothetical protein
MKVGAKLTPLPMELFQNNISDYVRKVHLKLASKLAVDP